MLAWKELDNLDHYSWGLVNKSPRVVCLQEISADSWDALLMLCGEKVGFFDYLKNVETFEKSSLFLQKCFYCSE